MVPGDFGDFGTHGNRRRQSEIRRPPSTTSPENFRAGAASVSCTSCRGRAQQVGGSRSGVQQATWADASYRHAADLFSVSLK